MASQSLQRPNLPSARPAVARLSTPAAQRAATRSGAMSTLMSSLAADGARLAGEDYPFVAPNVRPETNCFWSAKNTTSTGSATMTDPAATRLVSVKN